MLRVVNVFSIIGMKNCVLVVIFYFCFVTHRRPVSNYTYKCLELQDIFTFGIDEGRHVWLSRRRRRILASTWYTFRTGTRTGAKCTRRVQDLDHIDITNLNVGLG